jgi:protein-tyrosine phosphatase
MLKPFSLSAVLLISAFVSAEVENISCTQTGPSEYKINFSMTGDTRKVQIFASNDRSLSALPTPIADTSVGSIIVNAGKPGERMYFYLRPDHGRQPEVSIRHLALQGTPNFRDLGGYQTADGRFVRWGMIYRSGVLTNLTDSDLAYLSRLGVRVVCDFRTQQENADSPEKWVAGDQVKHISLPIGTESKGGTNVSMQQLLANNPDPAELRQRMAETYRTFAINAAPQFAELFRRLKEDRLPLLYHCTAGKDRTGVFSAFLLLSLGVPKEVVLQDYELTNAYFMNGNPNNPAGSKAVVRAVGNGTKALSPEQMQVLMKADRFYLESALQAIDEEYSSFDKYRRSTLGVSDEDLIELKAKLLEE